MTVEWDDAERWLMGSAWVDSLATTHINMLCDEIGPRWGSPANLRGSIPFIHAIE